MSLLVIRHPVRDRLAARAAGPDATSGLRLPLEWLFVFSSDARSLTQQGRAAPALLPRAVAGRRRSSPLNRHPGCGNRCRAVAGCPCDRAARGPARAGRYSRTCQPAPVRPDSAHPWHPHAAARSQPGAWRDGAQRHAGLDLGLGHWGRALILRWRAAGVLPGSSSASVRFAPAAWLAKGLDVGPCSAARCGDAARLPLSTDSDAGQHSGQGRAGRRRCAGTAQVRQLRPGAPRQR